MFVYIGRIWERLGWVRLGGWICYIPQFAVWYSYSWDWDWEWDLNDVYGQERGRGGEGEIGMDGWNGKSWM